MKRLLIMFLFSLFPAISFAGEYCSDVINNLFKNEKIKPLSDFGTFDRPNVSKVQLPTGIFFGNEKEFPNFLILKKNSVTGSSVISVDYDSSGSAPAVYYPLASGSPKKISFVLANNCSIQEIDFSYVNSEKSYELNQKKCNSLKPNSYDELILKDLCKIFGLNKNISAGKAGNAGAAQTAAPQR